MIAVVNKEVVKNDVMVSSIPDVENQTMYFTYPTLRFHVHLFEDSVHTITKEYNSTVGSLRGDIAVSSNWLLDDVDSVQGGSQPARAGNGR